MTVRVSVDIAPLRPEAWTTRAACHPHDAELWWALPGTAELELAKSICHNNCPVRALCLAAAEQRGETEGVWGGYDLAERLALRGGKPLPRRPRSASSYRDYRREAVATLSASGLTDREIGTRLHISRHAVKRQRQRLSIRKGVPA